MQIELTDQRELKSLQDYFLRLGASVRSEDATIHVDFPEGLLDEDESPEMYLRTWLRAHNAEQIVCPSDPGV